MTTKTALRKGRISGKAYAVKNLAGIDGADPGTFEGIVSVFGNVDYGGDRVVAGAFSKSLVRWEASGDPIPVIFSHQWDDLDAHVGIVLEAKELFPGDQALPPEIRANGGLWAKFRLDVEEDFAGRLAKRLDERRIKEFSFAYDVYDERRATDGVNELTELDLLELGPTLKGMNPATRLLSDALDDDPGTLMKMVRSGAKMVAHAFAGGDEDPTRCVLCGLTRNTVGHNTNAAAGDGQKAWVTLTGSMEETQEAAYEAAFAWAMDGNIGAGGFYAAYLEATFDDRVVVLVEGWDDPLGEGLYYELDYAVADDGTATVSNPREVGLETTTVAKARAMKHRGRPGSILAEKSRATVPGEPHPGKGKGKAEAGDGKAEDPTTRTGTGEDDGGDPALALLELAELEMT